MTAGRRLATSAGVLLLACRVTRPAYLHLAIMAICVAGISPASLAAQRVGVVSAVSALPYEGSARTRARSLADLLETPPVGRDVQPSHESFMPIQPSSVSLQRNRTRGALIGGGITAGVLGLALLYSELSGTDGASGGGDPVTVKIGIAAAVIGAGALVGALIGG